MSASAPRLIWRQLGPDGRPAGVMDQGMLPGYHLGLIEVTGSVTRGPRASAPYGEVIIDWVPAAELHECPAGQPVAGVSVRHADGSLCDHMDATRKERAQ